ncbi:cysteine desulfurase family protein [Fontisphaera persica]|uniref:cysteine desulfurase family protein n=1 Tax=Fontisphaera persica TaxID=2974023 RepID=UPI0024BFBE71|nr:cysteine desulfurase family protein [Fontisphaera persica]WCJ58813.1 cysteine desulfurase family protein [Fontisphaera persica]
MYLDYNAATPLDARVREAMAPFLNEIFGNPSSIHARGRQARAHLDEAHERLAALLQCKPSEIIFTSGGTEANNLAILGAARALKHKGRHLITSRIEHHAVLECFHYLEKHEGFEVTYVPAESDGSVSPHSIESAIRKDTVLISLMAANNETGAVQPVKAVGSLCRKLGICFHTDAVQWLGKLPFGTIHDFEADLVAGCAHKLHGPKGAGFLFVRSPFKPQPLMLGGPQENELRAGTENLAQIAGLVDAFERFCRPPVFDAESIRSLAQEIRSFLNGMKGVNVIKPPNSLPNTVAFTVKGATSLEILANLDLEGIQASAGAACMSGALQPSHVLLGMGRSREEANSLIRISLGRENTPEDIEHFKQVFSRLAAKWTTSE